MKRMKYDKGFTIEEWTVQDSPEQRKFKLFGWSSVIYWFARPARTLISVRDTKEECLEDMRAVLARQDPYRINVFCYTAKGGYNNGF